MTYRQYIALLRTEYRSRHEGTPPPATQLLREPWVSEYLRVMFPAPGPQTPSPVGEASTPSEPLAGAWDAEEAQQWLR